MEDEAPIVRYDAAAGTLRLRLTGGEEVAIAGLGPDLAFWRGGGAEPVSAPIWLSAKQVDVLGKMIDHILQNVRISAPSRQVLEELGPQVAQLKEELEAADKGSPSDAEYAAD